MRRLVDAMGWNALLGVVLLAGTAGFSPLSAQAPDGNRPADLQAVASPDGRNAIEVGTWEGNLYWSVQRDGEYLLVPGLLGFEFRGAPALVDGLRIEGVERGTHDETWEQPWGEQRLVRDHHNEMVVNVVEGQAPRRRFQVIFRAFDDGVAFRYHFPEQPALGAFEIQEELTEFAFADNATAWWIPSDRPRFDRSEMLYASSPVSVLDSVQTPLTLQTRDRETVLVVHEAHLEDYARMFLAGDFLESNTLRAALAPLSDGVKVRGRTPFRTPWRYVQIADRPEDLVPSVLGLNLNPPSVIEDTGWIEPMRYVGIWWDLHINTKTWEIGPEHGATTEYTREFIDFAAEHGFGGVLVEGWNTGWEDGWVGQNDVFSFTEPYPDYDLPGLAAYAREKGVDLIVHNETSGGIYNYERQLDEAFDLYESLGLRAIKSGYVADTLPSGDSHYSQEMVRHHRLVLEKAAEHGIMMNVHEPVHDTGERRTYPNMMTREGSRGQEYNAWSGDGGNPPEHEAILFFTRLIPGPMDFTPGVLDMLLESSPSGPRSPLQARPRTTVAKQLAFYVVIYSPMQMAADLPQNYEGHPAFEFIRTVAVDWEQTRVLAAEIGDYVVVAREARGTGEPGSARGASGEWFLGAITDEEARTVEVSLDFLAPGRRYVAEIYADGPGAHWKDDPFPLEVRRVEVGAGDALTLEMAPGGGQAIRFRPVGEGAGSAGGAAGSAGDAAR